MPPENNFIKSAPPTGPGPPSYDRPITVGHQPVMDKAKTPTENNDGSMAIPVTVNHSFTPSPEPPVSAPTSFTPQAPTPSPMNEAPSPEAPAPMPEMPGPTTPSDSHPLQAKIDAHPLFQNDGYNPQPPDPVPGPLPLAGSPIPKRRRGRKLLWLVLFLVTLLGGYTAVDILTTIRLPFELF